MIYPESLERLCRNRYNELGYPAGDFLSVKQAMDTCAPLSADEVSNWLVQPERCLYELSFGMYQLAMKHIQTGQLDTGFRLLHVAADDYLNPYSMVKLAQLYYHGGEGLKQRFPDADLTIDKNLEQAFYYIGLATQLAALIVKATGDEMILNGVTSWGLALLDTFHGMNINGLFDTKAAVSRQEQQYEQALTNYRQMYL